MKLPSIGIYFLPALFFSSSQARHYLKKTSPTFAVTEDPVSDPFNHVDDGSILVQKATAPSIATSPDANFPLYALPRFADPIPNITVAVGREASMPCIVDHLMKYKVAWVRVDSHTILTIHNKVITRNYRISLSHAGGRRWELKIANVQESDRGWYMCQINTEPMRYHQAYLEVVVPPDIVDMETSTDMIVREGSNVTLTCKAKGHPTPHIIWRREDGDDIGHGPHQRVNSVDGETLHLPRVSRTSMGAYLCIASNGVPPSVSKRISLGVQFPPMLWIPHQLEGTTVGQEVTLVCHTEAYPRPITYWKNERDEMLSSNDKYVITAAEGDYKVSMTLRIRNITPQDFQSYRCVVRNALGEADGRVRLYEIPAVTRLPLASDHYITLADRTTKKLGTPAVEKSGRSWTTLAPPRHSDVPNGTNGVKLLHLAGNLSILYLAVIVGFVLQSFLFIV